MIGNTIIELRKTASTNQYAAALLDQGHPEEGTVIRAHEQYAGRGQGSHTWSSDPGKNLTFSLILFPTFLPAGRQFMLNKAISLGILDFAYEALYLQPENKKAGRKRQVSIQIKWPNDLYLDSRKAGGVLMEHRIQGAHLAASVIGIGLNINQVEFSEDIPNPVSLKSLTGQDYNLTDALRSVCRAIELRYLILKSTGGTGLDEEYRRHLLGFGQWMEFSRKEGPMEGKVTGVDDLGRLLVEGSDGVTVAYKHQEIFFRI